jgi:hypothetical protein
MLVKEKNEKNTPKIALNSKKGVKNTKKTFKIGESKKKFPENKKLSIETAVKNFNKESFSRII